MISQDQQNETCVLFKARPQNPNALLALQSAYMRPVYKSEQYALFQGEF